MLSVSWCYPNAKQRWTRWPGCCSSKCQRVRGEVMLHSVVFVPIWGTGRLSQPWLMWWQRDLTNTHLMDSNWTHIFQNQSYKSFCNLDYGKYKNMLLLVVESINSSRKHMTLRVWSMQQQSETKWFSVPLPLYLMSACVVCVCTRVCVWTGTGREIITNQFVHICY